MMGADDAFNDGEAEAAAAFIQVAIATIKALKHMRQVGGQNADTRVAHK